MILKFPVGRGFHVTHCEPKAERGRGAKWFPLTIEDVSLYKDDEWFELSGTQRLQYLNVERGNINKLFST